MVLFSKVNHNQIIFEGQSALYSNPDRSGILFYFAVKRKKKIQWIAGAIFETDAKFFCSKKTGTDLKSFNYYIMKLKMLIKKY